MKDRRREDNQQLTNAIILTPLACPDKSLIPLDCIAKPKFSLSMIKIHTYIRLGPQLLYYMW
jgi:hypothetical protein